MKETLRTDLATVPGLLAAPAPGPTPSPEELAAEMDEIPEPTGADQLDMFG
jgi:hypothetical protein